MHLLEEEAVPPTFSIEAYILSSIVLSVKECSLYKITPPAGLFFLLVTTSPRPVVEASSYANKPPEQEIEPNSVTADEGYKDINMTSIIDHDMCICVMEVKADEDHKNINMTSSRYVHRHNGRK